MTTWPPPARIMSGRNSRVTIAAPTKLTSTRRWISSGRRLLERVVDSVTGIVDQHFWRFKPLAIRRAPSRARRRARATSHTWDQTWGEIRAKSDSAARSFDGSSADDADLGAAPQQVSGEMLADAARAAGNEDPPSRHPETSPSLRIAAGCTGAAGPNAAHALPWPQATRFAELRAIRIARAPTCVEGNRRCELPRGQDVQVGLLRPVAIARAAQQRAEHGRRQVVHQRQAGVMLDREPAVRRRDEESLADAAQLAQRTPPGPPGCRRARARRC